MRIAELAFPGELRERLIAAILAGEKTATTECVQPAGGHREHWTVLHAYSA